MTAMRIGRRAVIIGGAGIVGAAAVIGRGEAVRASARVWLVLQSGAIDILLHDAAAPLSCADFLRYVDGHDYDGGVFSRVVRADNDHGATRIDVVQGGVRPGATLLRPVAHESTRLTGLRHLDGTISLPRDKPGSASGAEFFICIGAQPSLDFGGGRNPDGQGFAAFGQVVAGMDRVRAIWGMDAHGASPDAYTAGQMLTHPAEIVKAIRI